METFITFFSSSLIIYKIIIIAIPIVIFLLYIKSCKISNELEHLAKEQEYTNDFLIKQIEQNNKIIELLKANNIKYNEQKNLEQL